MKNLFVVYTQKVDFIGKNAYNISDKMDNYGR